MRSVIVCVAALSVQSAPALACWEAAEERYAVSPHLRPLRPDAP
jgi:hypothetical protein